MARVFTITSGLENMGALRTGGQGSVYKARRTGEIITAVKLLPTPIHSESGEDRNFTSFQSEVEKLKKVNERPNPHVVKILSSGITETGNLPFIEMEFIEGPDLEELLRPPRDPLFPLKEAVKLCEQLSSALAHCHSLGIKHGDMKSNNVKLNIHTGNYVLLDFGLAVMSDEQRRTSLRHAGAVEFMAPEQSEGRLLFQSDVYSFGVVLYEVLTGRVPFPLPEGGGGEMGRNSVMLSHLERTPESVVEGRRRALPESWSGEERAAEGELPPWLVTLVERCLSKKPEDRFATGEELHRFVVHALTRAGVGTGKPPVSSVAAVAPAAAEVFLQRRVSELEGEKRLLQERNEGLQRQLSELQQQKRTDPQRIHTPPPPYRAVEEPVQREGVSKSAFYSLLLVTALLGALAAYAFFRKDDRQIASTTTSNNVADTTAATEQPLDYRTEEPAAQPQTRQEPDQTPIVTDTSTRREPEPKREEAKVEEPAPKPKEEQEETTKVTEPEGNAGNGARYKVRSRAYFHNEPDESTRRNAYIVHWNDAVLTSQNEKDGFVYVVFTNHQGQTSKGWLRKQDLVAVDE